MSKSINNRLFSVNGCLTQEALLHYVAGRLEHSERSAVEEHITHCLLCSDAVDGIMEMQETTHPQPFVDNLRTEVIAAVTKKNTSPALTRRRNIITWTAAAAIAAVIFISWFSLTRINDQEQKVSVSENIEKSPAGSGERNETVAADSISVQTTRNKAENTDIVEKETTRNQAVAAGKGYYVQDYRNFGWASDSVSVTGGILKTDMNDGDTKDQSIIAGEAEKQSLNKVVTEEDKYLEDLETKNLLQEVTTVTTGDEQQNYKSDNGKSSGKKKENKKSEEEPNRAVGGAPVFDAAGAATSSPDQLFADALVLYNAGEYNAAIERFEVLLAKNQSNDAARYFCALSYHKSGNSHKAITWLDKLCDDKNSSFYELAQWQKALILIDIKEFKKARKVLSDIVAAKGSFSKHASDKLIEIGQ